MAQSSCWDHTVSECLMGETASILKGWFLWSVCLVFPSSYAATYPDPEGTLIFGLFRCLGGVNCRNVVQKHRNHRIQPVSHCMWKVHVR